MNRRPIGVFDSGVGGLTVAHALERELPDRSLVYLGDTARVPYGTKSAATVRRYAEEAARFLLSHDVQMIVVACNTASAVALDAVVEASGLPVVGVIQPGADRAVAATKSGRIGVIGTRSTIDSQAYEQALRARRADCEVTSLACPLFVPLAEEGWTDNAIAHEIAETYLAPLREAEVDTLVLGCTHYPLLRATIRNVMGERVTLVDSAEAAAGRVRQQLPSTTSNDLQTTDHRFYVTDVAGPFHSVAERFFGRQLRQPEQVEIETELHDSKQE